MDWAQKQPHLPEITELQALQFLHSCYYRLEPAKTALDNFFTMRTICVDLFGKHDLKNPHLKEAMEIALLTPLERKTPENYHVVLAKLLDTNSDYYNFNYQCALFDIVALLDVFCKGPKDGVILVFDLEGGTLGHLAKLNIVTAKKVIYYLQESFPIRLKGIHLINPVSFIDRILSIVKPFMKKELINMLHVHTNIENLYKFVPKECLPQEYGGQSQAQKHLHRETNDWIAANMSEVFDLLNKQQVDESRRPGKPKREGDIFGMEGSFKKLQVD